MTWEPYALALGTWVVGVMLGIALGYTRGRIDGRMEMARQVLRHD